MGKGDVPDLRTGEGYLRQTLGSDMAELAKWSPVNHANKIKAPVFLVHGAQDQRVPIEHAEAMREALTKAGNPPEWLVFNYEGHGFYKAEHNIEFYDRLASFLGKHIGK